MFACSVRKLVKKLSTLSITQYEKLLLLCAGALIKKKKNLERKRNWSHLKLIFAARYAGMPRLKCDKLCNNYLFLIFPLWFKVPVSALQFIFVLTTEHKFCVYKPTRSTKFLWLDFIFPLDVLHVSDYISPSSGANLWAVHRIWYMPVYAGTIRLAGVWL